MKCQDCIGFHDHRPKQHPSRDLGKCVVGHLQSAFGYPVSPVVTIAPVAHGLSPEERVLVSGSKHRTGLTLCSTYVDLSVPHVLTFCNVQPEWVPCKDKPTTSSGTQQK